MPATPVRVPRRPRLSTSDDISHLSLAEVRDRLARNERVLGSALFSTSPTAGAGMASIVHASPFAIGSYPPTSTSTSFGNSNSNGAGPSARPTATATASPTSPPDDPVRHRLLAVREALRAREAELLAGSISSMSLEGGALATSPPTRSGKARALEAIRLTEARGGHSISLPIQQSLALGTRDFDNQTAARLANMNLNQSRQERRHVDDELGRAAAAAQYARAHVDDDDDDMFDTDEAYAAASVYASARRDAGNGLPLTTVKARRAEDIEDEDMDASEEEDEDRNEFAEGNDEYPGASPDKS